MSDQLKAQLWDQHVTITKLQELNITLGNFLTNVRSQLGVSGMPENPNIASLCNDAVELLSNKLGESDEHDEVVATMNDTILDLERSVRKLEDMVRDRDESIQKLVNRIRNNDSEGTKPVEPDSHKEEMELEFAKVEDTPLVSILEKIESESNNIDFDPDFAHSPDK